MQPVFCREHDAEIASPLAVACQGRAVARLHQCVAQSALVGAFSQDVPYLHRSTGGRCPPNGAFAQAQRFGT